MRRVVISLFVCLFLFTCFTNQASAYKRFYYCGKLNGGVYARTWGISPNLYTLHNRTVNYYDRALYAASSWNGINPTTTSSDDVSLTYTSSVSSATLRFYVGDAGDSGWDGGAALYKNDGTQINPYSTPGNWDYGEMWFNAYYTNHSTYTNKMINAIAGHEIGHVFGLDDLRNSSDHNTLMWYKSDSYRTEGISSDEVNGIRDIY